MKNKLIALIGSLLCGFVVITGCAGTGTFFSGNPTVEQTLTKIAIQQATLRAIQFEGEENAPARAAAVIKIVDDTQALLSTDPVITAAVFARVLDRVLPPDLTLSDRILVSQLSALILAEVEASVPVDQQNLPIAEISAVLGWVREAAVLVVPAP